MKSSPWDIKNRQVVIRRILTILTALTIHVTIQAQVDDSTSVFQSDFENFREGIVRDYDGFTKTNDSIFLLFLKESWTEFEGQFNEMPVSPKPAVQPVFEGNPKKDIQKDDDPNNNDSKDLNLLEENDNGEGPKEDSTKDKDLKEKSQMNDHLNSDSTSANLHQMPEPDAINYNQTITFYGSTISLPPFNASMPLLKDLSKEAVTDFYLQASISDHFKELVANVKMKSKSHQLNDWGYASLLMKVAGYYYTDNNNRTAFLWAALLMSGLNVKMGLNAKNAYLLVPADVTIYGVSYTIGNKEYYSIGPASPSAGEKLSIHQSDYPGNRSNFTVSILKAPLFEDDPLQVVVNNDKTLTVTINKNLMEFYRNYPPCDLEVPFNTPFTESVQEQLDALLLRILEGKNDDARTAMLLRFVQRAFRYKTDDEQFGRERYQFAEEILCNGAGDCEDRSALLAALLCRYTKHSLIGLRYPGHVSVAVNLSKCESPAFILNGGKHYYHCDPTYLGAECGIVMPSIKGKIPEVISIKDQVTNKL